MCFLQVDSCTGPASPSAADIGLQVYQMPSRWAQHQAERVEASCLSQSSPGGLYTRQDSRSLTEDEVRLGEEHGGMGSRENEDGEEGMHWPLLQEQAKCCRE